MANKNLRKGLSKELMYKKIMPSANKTEAAGTEDESEQLAESITAEIIEPIYEAIGNASGASPAAEPVDQQSGADSAALSQTGMPTEPGLFNVMEYLVYQRVDEVMAKFNCCNCSKCRKDTIALALNKLPPRYTVKSGDLTVDYTRNKSTAEVLTALVQAVLVVRANPRHDEE
jgi:competence protein ComFB